MRMWNVDPSKMCNKHLLGEHVELHMLIGCIKKNKSLKGFVENKLVEIHNIIERHEDLVLEILNRGMKHKSPIDDSVQLWEEGKVDREKNLIELKRRCVRCRELNT